VSANAAKSGKSVSLKVRQKSENAAGGFFQHSLLVSERGVPLIRYEQARAHAELWLILENVVHALYADKCCKGAGGRLLSASFKALILWT